MKDYFRQPAAQYRAAEIKIKASKFIAEVIPISERGEAEQALNSIRREFYDANHHCFAYRIGAEGLETRSSDDGEPSGTAGRPILTAIESAQMTNTLVVVTRYFGGTKLGTGPLARAYGEAASVALTSVDRKTVYLTTALDIRVGYSDISTLERLLQRYEAVKLDQFYSETAATRAAVRRSRVEAFLAELKDALHGREDVSKDEETPCV